MAVFEAATIVRTAPWLTMLIFIWSVVSGLFGDQLPTLYSSQQPIRLQQPELPVWHPSARPRQEVVLGPGIVQHEGRVLRLTDDAFSPPDSAYQSDKSVHQTDSLLKELENIGLASEQSALFTGGDLRVHEDHASAGDDWSRSQITQAVEQHDNILAQASHNQAAQNDIPAAASAADHVMKTEQEAAPEGFDHAAHQSAQSAGSDYAMEAAAESMYQSKHADANADDSSGDTSQDPQQMDSSESIGYTDGNDILGMVGLPAESTKEHHHPNFTAHSSHTAGHRASHVPSHMATNPHSDTPSLHPGNPPASATCFIHQDLPIPGMDIAPADKDRCYPHPPEYRNNNYLNDSFYMLYHHDIPTTHPHPAFTWGDLSRLARVSHKMRRNEPVTVTFVGCSVSSSYCQNPSVTCWVAPVSDWLKQQNPKVEIVNNAVGGTTSRTTAECFDAMVGKDADLIFLEYSYNDRFGIDPAVQQQGYELLVRKLLKLPHKPAVIVVHWWGPKHDCLTLVSKEEAEARSPDHPHHQCAVTLWNNTEDQIQNLVHHYGMQSISFRNAYWAEIDAEVDGFLPEQTLMPDLIHPSMRGVKLLGSLVIRFLSDSSAYTAKHDHMSKAVPKPVPEPLFIDVGVDEQSNTCTRGNALQDMKMHTVDWYWVDGKKPGFQTDIPGASLVLMVMLPEDQQVDKLSLGYLASYENMGWAQVECLGACNCPVLKFNANSTARASQEHFATFGVERQETGNGCVLKVTTLYRTDAVNDGHRFKVSSVAWSGGSNSHDSGVSQSTAQRDETIKHNPSAVDQVMSLGSD